ncbi:MAG TPA: hypothetical protein VKB31_01015 [Trueperaceae bacterium]|nr:hypothetical protein [Trueperaceae bacterium]
MIGLVAALRREVDGPLRRLDGARRIRLDGCVLHQGTLLGVPVTIAVTGMGAERGAGGARSLLERAPLAAMVSVGFAGALITALPVGSLGLPERLVLESRPSQPLASDAALRERLLPPARAAGLALRPGSCVTARRMVTAPAERAALAGAHAAELVDMEGYWLAREAQAAGVPFVSVRAVSDALEDHQPVLARAVSDGTMSVPRLLRGYVAHPREAGKLPRLMLNARRAAAALERFTLATLPSLAQEPAA